MQYNLAIVIPVYHRFNTILSLKFEFFKRMMYVAFNLAPDFNEVTY